MTTDPTPRRHPRHGRTTGAIEVDQRNDGGDFWGDARTWDDVAPQRRNSHDTASGSRLGRWWKSAATAGSTASRTHGAPGPAVAQDTVVWHDQDDSAASGVDAWEHERTDGWDIEPAPVRGGAGIDPLIARIGAVLVVVTVAASVVMGLTSGSDGEGQVLGAPSAATTLVITGSTIGESAASASVATPSTAIAAGGAATSEPSTTTAVAPASTGTPTATEHVAEAHIEAAALMVATEPETTAPACASEYELAAGDYWIRIADASGVRLADLLAVNEASVDTVLVPGRAICLPAGASTPAPPTTVAPPTSTRPANTTAPASTTTSSRSTPAVVAPAPTTTVPARPVAVPSSQAEAIIREVWPDELEDRALEIARRESNLQSNVNNWCCYGLFQIHWSAHRSWLATIGVTSAAQLYDPLVNASAAYTLYQRSGGFAPWGG